MSVIYYRATDIFSCTCYNAMSIMLVLSLRSFRPFIGNFCFQKLAALGLLYDHGFTDLSSNLARMACLPDRLYILLMFFSLFLFLKVQILTQ